MNLKQCFLCLSFQSLSPSVPEKGKHHNMSTANNSESTPLQWQQHLSVTSALTKSSAMSVGSFRSKKIAKRSTGPKKQHGTVMEDICRHTGSTLSPFFEAIIAKTSRET